MHLISCLPRWSSCFGGYLLALCTGDETTSFFFFAAAALLPLIRSNKHGAAKQKTHVSSQRLGDRLQLHNDTKEGRKKRGSLTAPTAINRILLITHWGFKFSTDNRPRLSWGAPAMQRCWMWRWPQNSCSGLPTPESTAGSDRHSVLPPFSCALAPNVLS